MKKIIMFGVASVITLAFSVTSFAGSKAEKNHHSFSLDFAANVLGNGAWDALLFLGKSLFRKL